MLTQKTINKAILMSIDFHQYMAANNINIAKPSTLEKAFNGTHFNIKNPRGKSLRSFLRNLLEHNQLDLIPQVYYKEAENGTKDWYFKQLPIDPLLG